MHKLVILGFLSLLILPDKNSSSLLKKVNDIQPDELETINWITNKLILYSYKSDKAYGEARYSTYDYSIYYDEESKSLVQKYKTNVFVDSKYFDTLSVTMVIPIIDLINVFYKDEINDKGLSITYFDLFTNKKSIISTTKSSNGFSSVYETNEAQIEFNITHEENIKNRMLTAFKRLISFYPKPKESY